MTAAPEVVALLPARPMTVTRTRAVAVTRARTIARARIARARTIARATVPLLAISLVDHVEPALLCGGHCEFGRRLVEMLRHSGWNSFRGTGRCGQRRANGQGREDNEVAHVVSFAAGIQTQRHLAGGEQNCLATFIENALP